MHLIIVGAGRTGRHVIQSAINDNHDVFVIEKDEKTANQIASGYDCMVINADASSMDALKEAKAEKADALIATTNDDAVNMLVILLGKELGVKRLISSVTNEDHIRLFEQMGIDTVESPFRLNGQFLYRAVQRPSVKDFLDLGGGIEIIEFTVNKNSPIEGKLIKELKKLDLLPKDARFIVIKRYNDLIIPDGETMVLAGDLVAVLSRHGITEGLVNLFK